MKRGVRVKIGDKKQNSVGSIMEVIEVKSSNNILVKFIDYEYITKTTCQNFEKGSAQCPYEPRVYGVGYLGEGKYAARRRRSNMDKLAYLKLRYLDEGEPEEYLDSRVPFDYKNSEYNSMTFKDYVNMIDEIERKEDEEILNLISERLYIK